MGRLLRRLGKGRRGRVPARGAAGAGLCAALVLALPGAATAAGNGNPYDFAEGARTVDGARSGATAAQLKTGETYRSSLAAGDGVTSYYRVELDGAATAYASVVAVPPLGSGVKAAAADGIAVSLRDGQGNQCDAERATFRSGSYPRPIAVAVERPVRPGGLRCQAAGTYYVVVERAAAAGSSERDWGLELRVATEPGLVSAVPGAGARSWPSEPAALPSGVGARRSGGTGFNDARALTSGAWKDRIGPGQSHFYRVPVDWGQQLSLGADLDGSADGGARRGVVPGALDMELYNPARAPVATKGATYSGGTTSAAFDPLPPVAYGNRLLSREDEAAMGLAGWYWLKVTLNPAMVGKAGGLGMTLRVAVDGAAKQAPDYVRDPGEFQVKDADLAAAERGEGGAEWDFGAGSGSGSRSESGTGSGTGSGSGPDADAGSGSGSGSGSVSGRGGASGGAVASSATSPGSDLMTLVGVAGVGTGSALVLWLGAWRVVAVRKVRRAQG
ncbi:hypothetical protein [Streptomyces endophyticus]|uniref:Peptidase n=1 Tax=Streptomyces endophyticus TaxID=714166 RepID=A0ABU6FH05_9ACTN|nr:hypothetical protein [Streptomyces endophyticus]MEB8342763.1 hypothetical protein [Streptomyces endophyticus]